jgi:hypothetical protein
MKRRKIFLYSISFVLLTSIVFVLIMIQKKSVVRESITYFPIDQETSFASATTKLFLYDQRDEDEYVLKWITTSDIGKSVYLRQDIGFLFADGLLIEKASKWEESSQLLKQSKKIFSEDSGHYQAVAFHQGEIHYGKKAINSSQHMSYDQLYVIDSPKTKLHSFKLAQSEAEKQWKQVLDHATMQQLKYKWSQLAKHYQIPLDKYKMIPLTSLPYYNDKPLPGLSEAKSQEVIGKLWEGLYKNYFLGLESKDGTTESPIGSTIPLILMNDNHIIVLFQSASGRYYQLLQYIER